MRRCTRWDDPCRHARHMKHATLRQLKVFEAVARLLSFSRAAEELHLTQPAVSTQVAKLAEHAGNGAVRAVRQEDLPDRGRAELLQLQCAIIGQFEAAEVAMARFPRHHRRLCPTSAHQRRRLLLSAPAAGFRGAAPGVAPTSMWAQPLAPARVHRCGNLTDSRSWCGRRPARTSSPPFAPHPYVVVAAPTHPPAAVQRIPRDGRSCWCVHRARGGSRHVGSRWRKDFAASMVRTCASRWRSAVTETIKQANSGGHGHQFPVGAHGRSCELSAGSLWCAGRRGAPLMLNWYVVHRAG